ncbi:hypothetical protein JVT61DRAFT_12808 [Boletus reticuloceps]|uniref:Nuclear segregation protein Bfr1 n=1 Tax=Boletus reticuloceps TaxID=495285 RepID=A0A8I3ACM5_9AGAM|nr:hypothetical protein JVT61DRAFT_12808 [Boletus reticuloceps]
MPASNATSVVVNGSGKKTKGTPESTVPPSPVSKSSETDRPGVQSAGKPNKIAYEAEQERLKSEIDALQAKLNTAREKITMASKPSGNDRRNALRAELDSIREQQSSYKISRGKILDQLKALQDDIQKKTKDLQAARGKTPFRSVEEVDVHIKYVILTANQSTGITNVFAQKPRKAGRIRQPNGLEGPWKVSRPPKVRSTQTGSAADEYRQQLDDPESKAISDRYDKIKAELDELKKESDEAYAGRTKLFEERDELQAQITALFNEKRSSAQQFREANDRYWTKVNEDRARRAERARAQRAAEEAQKRLEHAQQLREEASLPAYQAEMQDCQTLIDALSGKSSDTVVLPSSSLPAKSDVAGVPKLELRQVETVADGLVARKKKGEGEETYFMGKGKREKKDKIPKVAHETDALKNLPFGTITALSKCAIPFPTTVADVPRVIEDLKTKKAWYEANQARVTAENIAKAEAQIQRLTNAVKLDGRQVSVDSNGSVDAPLESASTPVENVEAAATVDVDE